MILETGSNLRGICGSHNQTRSGVDLSKLIDNGSERSSHFWCFLLTYLWCYLLSSACYACGATCLFPCSPPQTDVTESFLSFPLKHMCRALDQQPIAEGSHAHGDTTAVMKMLITLFCSYDSGMSRIPLWVGTNSSFSSPSSYTTSDGGSTPSSNYGTNSHNNNKWRQYHRQQQRRMIYTICEFSKLHSSSSSGILYFVCSSLLCFFSVVFLIFSIVVHFLMVSTTLVLYIHRMSACIHAFHSLSRFCIDHYLYSSFAFFGVLFFNCSSSFWRTRFLVYFGDR